MYHVHMNMTGFYGCKAKNKMYYGNTKIPTVENIPERNQLHSFTLSSKSSASL